MGRILLALRSHLGHVTPGLQSIATKERLSAAQLVKDISKRGVKAHYFPEVDTMLPFIMSGAQAGDVLLIMSTGSFDNLIDRLLAELNKSPA